VVALLFFHLNGIAGDPYKTLTLALTGQIAGDGHGGVVRAEAGGTVTLLFERRLGRHLCAGAVHGRMLGGAVGYLDVTVFHHPADSIGAFAVVGMGAVFAGIVRAPMTSVLIIFEMTGGYGLVLPLMIANMSAFALARHWRHTPVYEALLEQDGIYLDQRHKPHPERCGAGG
jgi:chloride channel protein, CIC family